MQVAGRIPPSLLSEVLPWGIMKKEDFYREDVKTSSMSDQGNYPIIGQRVSLILSASSDIC